MIQQKLAVKTDDGGVVIMSVVLHDGRKKFYPDFDKLVAQSAEHGWNGKPVSWRLTDDAEITGLDRYFRGAWEDSGRLGVNLPKAREIHLSHIRIARDRELRRLDTEYIKADEAGDTTRKQEIAQRKQSLRDLPETFDLSKATTPEELKALWPPELTATVATPRGRR